MLDENAFGLLIAYFWIENDEYALETEEFVARLARFREIVLDGAGEHALGSDVSALDLGHAMYFELAEGNQSQDPISWLGGQRGRLGEAEIISSAVLTHGSRWVSAEDGRVLRGNETRAGLAVVRVGGPSEPLRRALDADGASRLDDADDTEGWGPGLYVEVDAIEALGKKFKNAPTPLRAGTGTFYRLGR